MGATIGMGLASDRLRAEVVDGIAGMELVRQLGVSGVPTVVLDDQLMLENPSPDDTLVAARACCRRVPTAAGRQRPVPGLRAAGGLNPP